MTQGMVDIVVSVGMVGVALFGILFLLSLYNDRVDLAFAAVGFMVVCFFGTIGVFGTHENNFNSFYNIDCKIQGETVLYIERTQELPDFDLYDICLIEVVGE